MPRFNPDDYVDVAERITRFWAEYPNGAIITDAISDPNNFGFCVIRTSIYKNRPVPGEFSDIPDSTGIAAEERAGTQNLPQFSSWWEVGETSSIGRALANMGYATNAKDRPSKQEMQKFNNYQERAATSDAPARQRSVSLNTIPDGVGAAQTRNQPEERPQSDQAATVRQQGFIDALARELGIADESLKLECETSFGSPQSGLSRRDASVLIERLQQRRAERPTTQAQMIDTTNAAERARN